MTKNSTLLLLTYKSRDILWILLPKFKNIINSELRIIWRFHLQNETIIYRSKYFITFFISYLTFSNRSDIIYIFTGSQQLFSYYIIISTKMSIFIFKKFFITVPCHTHDTHGTLKIHLWHPYYSCHNKLKLILTNYVGGSIIDVIT